MKININETQRRIILNACRNIETLYDFENTTEQEFKEVYNKSKDNIKQEALKLNKLLSNAGII